MCRRRTQSIIYHQSHTHTAILKSLLLRHMHKCAYHTRGYRSLWNPIFHIERLQHFDTIFNMYLTCSSDTTDTLKKTYTYSFLYVYIYIYRQLLVYCTAEKEHTETTAYKYVICKCDEYNKVRLKINCNCTFQLQNWRCVYF